MRAPPRLPLPDLAAGEQDLGGEPSRYFAKVLRLRAGDRFVAFDPSRGLEAEGRVVRVRGRTVSVEVGVPRAARVVARHPVTWIQGLAKGEKMDAIVRDATELGVTRFVPAATVHAVVDLAGPRAQARTQRWTRIARDAARQCGRADPPSIDEPRPWAQAVHAAREAGGRFCLFERASDPLGPLLQRTLAEGRDLAFAAGPEGGLSEDEVASARAQGFAVVSLGDLILRTETVASAVLGAVRILLASAPTR